MVSLVVLLLFLRYTIQDEPQISGQKQAAADTSETCLQDAFTQVAQAC